MDQPVISNLLQSFRADSLSGRSIYLQLSSYLLNAIRAGHIPANSKLVGSRKIAELTRLNRSTVNRSLQYLVAQGWLEARDRSGYFVKVDSSGTLLSPEINIRSNSFKFPLIDQNINIPTYSRADPNSLRIDDGFPDHRITPFRELIRSIKRRVIHLNNSNYFKYSSPLGSEIFREELTKYLNLSRGLNITPENILITQGAQMGFYLVSRLLLTSTSTVIVGAPGYKYAEETFKLTNCKVLHQPVDNDGIIIDGLDKLCRKNKISAVYVIPHHHYPTTVTLTRERRIELLKLAEKYGFAIIEDDYDFEYHYEIGPILPITSHDTLGTVLYIGTFSKMIASSFRMGFLVAPKDFIEKASKYRRLIDIQGNTLLELGMAELLKYGELDYHLRNCLKLYKARRDNFCQLLSNELGDLVEFQKPKGGLAVWIKFNSIQVEDIYSACIEERLSFNPMFKNENAIRAGYASLDFDEQKRVVEILGKAIKSL